MTRHLIAATLAAVIAPAAYAQNPPAAQPSVPAPTTIASKTAGLERHDGLIPVYLDNRAGKILLEIPRDSMRVLMFVTQATGLGSNPVGIDRGASGADQVTRFERNGDRVLVIFENWKYRSSSRDNPAHVRSVAESFPTSTAGAMPIVANESGRLLVDATDFLVKDWTDVVGTLARGDQGAYSLARDRSGVNRALTNAYPGNTEIDLSLTFVAGGRPGGIVSQVAPDGRSVTLREHVSFVKLPDDGYRPRELDPRVGFFGITFKDYAQPIQAPLDRRYIARHRLERVNPSDPNSPIKNPIMYYVDAGMPEPIRTAALQGAKFWEQAFDAAGLKGGFKVALLPEGADPMDARYNIVQWVNRNERGWSIGGSLGDPRTGEILKAMARMDSHRNRTAYNLYAALVGAEPAAADTAFVLGRVRQVTAHEMGHTLGMAHNYIASTYERASVMDYPAPRVTLDKAGNVDVSQAYAPAAGSYDVWAIRWAYGIFPPGSEQDSLRAIVSEGLKKGYLFLSDNDARPDYASDPRVNLWDDASTAAGFFKTQSDVRRVAIMKFGLRNIRAGEPVALLQERFVPLYFFHRFAINSLAKTIGGVEYANAIAGDGQQETRVVGAAEQRRALAMLTAALSPKELAIPDTVLTLLGPRPFDYPPYVELFRTRTSPVFDEFGAARTLSQMIVEGALQRDRAARLVQQAAHDKSQLTLDEVIDGMVAATWNATSTSPKEQALARASSRAVADVLLDLAADKRAAPEARAMAEYKIARLRDIARTRAAAGEPMARAHWSLIAGDFTRWIERRELPTPTPALLAPPGDPFGDDEPM
ncbi:MAG: zinc-dependent metalloprotease [Gemmatimonadota bacterium]|nr:zinc-dependent metalloprotease [Gemmatimonadota bacterium]